MENNIVVTVQQGKRRLARLESVAAGRFRRSSKDFDRGMRTLRTIRDTGAWHYALDDDDVMLSDYQRPKWEHYIRLFCDKHRIGRSTTFAALNTIDTWYALGLPEKALEEVGLDKAKEIRHIARYDGRSKELELPPETVIEQLPPADSPLERVKKKIEEVLIDPPEPLRPKDIRDSFTIDTGVDEEVSIFQAGSGDIWFSYEGGEHLSDGTFITAMQWKELDPKFREWLIKKLKIQEYKNEEGK